MIGVARYGIIAASRRRGGGGGEEPPTPTFATNFGGTNERVACDSASEVIFSHNEPFSLALWFRTSDASSAIRTMLAQGTNTSGYALQFGSGHTIRFILIAASPSGNIQLSSTDTYNDGQWHHAVLTFSGNSSSDGLNLYIDGELAEFNVAGSGEPLTGSSTDGSNFSIGSTATPAAFWIGDLDEVGVYSGELSSSDVESIYAEGSVVDLSAISLSASLVGYWRMGDGATFPTIPDASGNGNNGTMLNMESEDIFER